MPSVFARARFCSNNYSKHTAGQDHRQKIFKKTQTQPSYREDVRGIPSAWIRPQSLCIIYNHCFFGLNQDFDCSEQAQPYSYLEYEIEQPLPAAWRCGQEVPPSARVADLHQPHRNPENRFFTVWTVWFSQSQIFILKLEFQIEKK